MKKLLFICSRNKLRSPTAEEVFCMDERLEVRSAGLDKDALNTLSSEDLEWADIIFVMETSHKNRLAKKYREFIRGKRVICLNIPDEYEFMDSELVQIFKTRIPLYLGTY